MSPLAAGRQVLRHPREDPLNANLKHLQFMLSKVFTFPRNHRYNTVHLTLMHPTVSRFDKATQSKLKEDIGSYIWRKLGSLGLLTGAQQFSPTQFLYLVSTINNKYIYNLFM